MSTPRAVTLDADHRRCPVGGEPMIFHCHHYNVFLQRSILDADYLDSEPYLVGAAAEVAFAQLTQVFADGSVDGVPERAQVANELYRWAGFGTLDLGAIGADGGSFTTPNSHYSIGWKARWGVADKAVCYFARGWIAGALAAIHDLPDGSFRVAESACSACGADGCTFVATRGEPDYPVFTAVGAGVLSTHQPREAAPNNVDYDGIFTAVSGMDLSGNEQGMIPAFGVYLTRHYANYYNRTSFETLRAMHDRFGDEGYHVAAPLLIEAGKVCAFNTLGGIMVSTEWDALIKPQLKTPEDWIHGALAVANTFGWGRWQVTKLTKDEAEFVMHDDYEAVGYRSMYGGSNHHVSFLAHGGAEGLMSLLYVGDITQKPVLDSAYYDSVFKNPEVSYAATCTASRAKGDDVTAFTVVRQSK